MQPCPPDPLLDASEVWLAKSCLPQSLHGLVDRLLCTAAAQERAQLLSAIVYASHKSGSLILCCGTLGRASRAHRISAFEFQRRDGHGASDGGGRGRQAPAPKARVLTTVVHSVVSAAESPAAALQCLDALSRMHGFDSALNAADSAAMNSPLHLAILRSARCCPAAGDYEPLLRWLIDHGAGLENSNTFAQTPLLVAAAQDAHRALAVLLGAGADLLACDRVHGSTALVIATIRREPVAVDVILQAAAERGGVLAQRLLDKADRRGKTADDHARLGGGHRGIVDALRRARSALPAPRSALEPAAAAPEAPAEAPEAPAEAPAAAAAEAPDGAALERPPPESSAPFESLPLMLVEDEPLIMGLEQPSLGEPPALAPQPIWGAAAFGVAPAPPMPPQRDGGEEDREEEGFDDGEAEAMAAACVRRVLSDGYSSAGRPSPRLSAVGVAASASALRLRADAALRASATRVLSAAEAVPGARAVAEACIREMGALAEMLLAEQVVFDYQAAAMERRWWWESPRKWWDSPRRSMPFITTTSPRDGLLLGHRPGC